MGIFDWSIVIIFLIMIVWVGIYSMRYVRGVTDFLACGRVCGRYVISVADVANGLALITMIGAVEVGYKSGGAYSFWGVVSSPLMLFLSLTGFVFYRFRLPIIRRIRGYCVSCCSRSEIWHRNCRWHLSSVQEWGLTTISITAKIPRLRFWSP